MPLVHPRPVGIFPRRLEHYVREEKLMGLEEAGRRMITLPASILHLKYRGLLNAGTFADIVVFDSRGIIDHATFEDPNHYSEGVRYLFVNGKTVVQEGQPTRAFPSRALRRPGYKPGVL